MRVLDIMGAIPATTSHSKKLNYRKNNKPLSYRGKRVTGNGSYL